MFELNVRFIQLGEEVLLPVRVQATSWFVDSALLGRADQQTGRAYHWSVRIVLRETGTDGEVTFIPRSPSSEERTFYWIP